MVMVTGGDLLVILGLEMDMERDLEMDMVRVMVLEMGTAREMGVADKFSTCIGFCDGTGNGFGFRNSD
jgi:hypothetical protein